MHSKVKTSILILVIIFITALLSACGKKNVPEYQGIFISETFPTLTDYNNELQSNNFNKLSSNENPFGNNTQTIEEKLKDYLILPATTEIDFYATPSMDIYLTIKLDNPSKFEIVSVTLNGGTYLPHDLEVGSDQENLILLTSSGNIEGISSYTVDKIMYSDGRKTKEVNYTGERTVKLGIEFTEAPLALIYNREIKAFSIDVEVVVADVKYAIETTGMILKAVLYDGKDIIRDINIKVGRNQVKFDKLDVDTYYQIAVVTCYDMVDGQGIRMDILKKEVVRTENALIARNTISDSESIAFDIAILSPDNNVKVSGVELYKDDELVQSLTEFSNPSFNNLLSNTTYTIKVIYTYNLNDGTGPKSTYYSTNITTYEKREPYLYFKNLSSSKDAISFNIEVEDLDNTGEMTSVEIYQGNTLIKSSDNLLDIAFTGLLPNEEYKINAKYTFDLNDGLPERVYESEFNYKTLADFEITNIEILNEGDRMEYDDDVLLRITLENPDLIPIEKFIISGQEINLPNSSTGSVLELSFRTDFPGGKYIAKVDEIGYKIYDKMVTAPVDSDIADEILILGSIEIDSIYNDDDNIFCSDNDKYIYIKFYNPTGYDISKISLEINNYSQSFDKEDINFISKEIIKIPITIESINQYFITRISVSEYSYDFFGEPFRTISNNQGYEYKFFVLKEIESRAITTISDLINIQPYYRYHLVNDIDLKGANWEPLEFNGVIQGNGYKIKNLTIEFDETPSTEVNLGLFSKFKGLIDDLHLEDLKIDVSGYFCPIIGGLVANLDFISTIQNSSVNGEIKSDSSDIVYVGGIAGYAYQGLLINNYTNIIFNVRSGVGSTIGGIIGYDIKSTTHQNTVEGSIGSASNDIAYITIGGIIGYSKESNVKANMVSSKIDVAATSKHCIGGIIGDSFEGEINQNFFKGKININYDGETISGFIGGIGGLSNKTSFKSNLVLGEIIITATNETLVGGIIGEVFKGYAEDNIFGGSIEVQSTSLYIFASSITIEGTHDIDYNKNYVLSESIININNQRIDNVGDMLLEWYLNQEYFYLDELNWDKNIWDFSRLHYYIGYYPVLK